MILAFDPGKSGGAALIDDDGDVAGLWVMPLAGGQVDPVGVAQIYNSVRDICPFDEQVRVVVEKLFTKPTDAVSKDEFSNLVRVAKLASEVICAVDGGYATPEHYDAMRNALRGFKVPDENVIRLDGRKGVLTYAKGAGVLFMGALWEWPVLEVSPRTWQGEMFTGVDTNLKSKEKAAKACSMLWPKLMAKGEVSFLPDGKRKPHEGLCDAALIGEWARRFLKKSSSVKRVG